MKVKIINGYYGHHTKFGVKAIGANDAPIDLPAEDAIALVDAGIAAYATDEAVATASADIGQTANGETAPHEENDAASENSVPAIPQFGYDTKASELRAIARAEGITFAVGTSKADMVDVLTEHFYGGDAPELTAEAPVEA